MPTLSEARERLQALRDIALVPGDLLLFHGYGLWSWAIREFSQSPYSHIGILDCVRKQWQCLEAVEKKGVRPIALELLLARYHGEIELWHIQQATFDRDKALEYAWANAGLDYSNRQLVRILLGLDVPVAPDRFICSLFVKRYLDEGDFEFTVPISRVPKPGDIVRQPGLDLIARLK